MERAGEETLGIMRKMGYLTRLHMLMTEKDSREEGLWRGQMMALAYLCECEGPVSQKNIAERFRISKPAVTELVKRLEEKGLVDRAVSDEDQRVRLISITDEGRNVTDVNRGRFADLNIRMAENIPAEEMEVFSRVLDRMISNLRAIDA